MILLLDNYDSFTYNLFQYIGSINPNVIVHRNDAISIKEIEEMQPSHIVISPGPGRPEDAGISIEVIKHFYNKIPILGVCLGHQSIGEAFGGRTTYAMQLMHGKTSEVTVKQCPIFKDMPKRFKAARYHSLVIDREVLPEDLIITATTDDGEIMGVMHKVHKVYGIQFHPESIITEHGMTMIKNFLEIN